MKTVILAVALIVAVGMVGCKARPIKYLAVNDRPLNERELALTNDILLSNMDSTINEDYADRQVHPRCAFRRVYRAEWGSITSTWSVARDFGWSDEVPVVRIDGIDSVKMPGRWWLVVREALNGLARASDYKAWQADSVRLFKLDSTMKSIGR